MNTQETTTMLEDRKVNVKAKLALLWVALMFFYIYPVFRTLTKLI